MAIEAATMAKNEGVRAVAENDIAYDGAVIDYGFLAITAEDRDFGALDEAGILHS